MKKLPALTFAFFVAVATACQSPESTQSQPNAYYDVAGFVTGQIGVLSSQRPTVTKAMEVSGEEESTTREVDWTRELELFMQADINKPAYRYSYTTTRPDSLTYLYTVRPGEDLPVRYLRVKLHSPDGNPREIEAKVLTQNKLYQSEKQLLLRCGDVRGTWRVLSYQIRGFQELAIAERKPFAVRAEVL
jgi:hypothetical protein